MTTLDLLSGPITLSRAKAVGRDVLFGLQFPGLKAQFYQRIENQRLLLQDVVAHHLSISPSDVTISPQGYWSHGSFNLVIPVAIDTDERPQSPPCVCLRFPLPYRVGESFRPGNADEKLSCEAATYAWIQQNCPIVPIPQLYGFALSTNEKFTNLNSLPWWSIETITSGEMLSDSWDEGCNDARLQNNLQRDLARIMISLASVPLPRIGAFRLDHKGYLHLDNRPLSVQDTIQENEGIPPGLSRGRTFSRVDDYVLSHLSALDSRLLHQPNAITKFGDAEYQMTSLAAARSIFPQMFRRYLNCGPFVYSFIDLHRSNQDPSLIAFHVSYCSGPLLL